MHPSACSCPEKEKSLRIGHVISVDGNEDREDYFSGRGARVPRLLISLTPTNHTLDFF